METARSHTAGRRQKRGETPRNGGQAEKSARWLISQPEFAPGRRKFPDRSAGSDIRRADPRRTPWNGGEHAERIRTEKTDLRHRKENLQQEHGCSQ